MSYTFTFILQFRGGTYISQIEAPNAMMAKDQWARNLDEHSIEGMGSRIKASMIKSVAEDVPTPIAGMNDVWCLHGIASGRSFLVHFVRGLRR